QMRAVAASSLLASLPAERIGRELHKALAAPKPSRWLAVLAEGGCLAPWLCPLEKAADIPAGPVAYHSGSVLAHLMEMMDAVAGDPLRVWMALCHDLGKMDSPAAMLPHHYGHELRGAVIAEQLALRLGLPTRYRTAGALTSLLHMKAGIYATLRPGTRCDLLTQVHGAGLDEPFWAVVEADSGLSLRASVQRDLDRILSVKLPPLWQNRGKDSGLRLRLLRCKALSAG
ncbi:MAG: HD domain-containing protein, partial [Bilophila sp.]